LTAHDDYQAYILAMGPIAYWTFQGLAPGALLDISGNGHDLSGTGSFLLANPTNLDGFQSAYLDGSSAYFTPSGAINPAHWTVLGIAFPQGGPGHIFNTEALTNSGAGCFVGDSIHNFGWGVRTKSAGGGEVTVVDPKSFGTYGSGFVQVAGVYDGVNASISVNGQVQASAIDLAYAPGTVTPRVGCAAYTPGTVLFTGYLSDLAIFDYAVPLPKIVQSAGTAGLQTPVSAPDILAALKEIADDTDAILASVRKTF
jgi:hypothetical protein